jgi:hypothetical protein
MSEKNNHNQCRQSNVNVFAFINRQRSDVSRFLSFFCYDDILFIFIYNTLRLLMHRTFDLKWYSCHCCACVYLNDVDVIGRACFNEHVSSSLFYGFTFSRFFSSSSCDYLRIQIYTTKCDSFI